MTLPLQTCWTLLLPQDDMVLSFLCNSGLIWSKHTLLEGTDGTSGGSSAYYTSRTVGFLRYKSCESMSNQHSPTTSMRIERYHNIFNRIELQYLDYREAMAGMAHSQSKNIKTIDCLFRYLKRGFT